MNASVEKLEANKVKLTFHVSPERFEEGLAYSYNKQKSSINLPGFRKGKVPRKIIEMQFGKEIFFPDAIDYVFNDAYADALNELEITTVDRPKADLVEASIENGAVFTAEVVVKPEVTIENYKGVTYPKYNIIVTDEDIEKEIGIDREKNSRTITVSDESTVINDTVRINFEGFVDGVAFSGGKGEDYELVLGSQTFINGFEEQIIGHMVGDKFSVNVSFPDNYFSEDLKGKAATFEVELIDVKRKLLPDVDDDFAQDVSEFETLEEYKNSIRKKLDDRKASEAIRDKEDKVMRQLIEELVGDIPEVMYDNQVEQQLREFKSNLQAQGMTFEMYLSYIRQTEEQVKETLRPGAIAQVKGRLALEAIAEKENIEITQDEVSAELDNFVKIYRIEKSELEKTMTDAEYKGIRTDLKVQKALTLVLDEAICTE